MKPSEPVALVTSAEVFVLALINLCAIVFGWSAEIVAAVNGVAVSAVLLGAGIFLRLQVTPVKDLAARLQSLSENS